MLRDLAQANGQWKIALLRYFNPVGAHPSGLIGEDPNGIPNNLLPYIAQVAIGRLAELRIFGGDYPTRDGTGIRDYLHVCDLAAGHVAALNCIDKFQGAEPLNLGTGRGYSVLEVVRAFEAVTGLKVPARIVARRAGDVPTCFADPSISLARLGWKAQRDIREMAGDLWRWQTQNPNGYPE